MSSVQKLKTSFKNIENIEEKYSKNTISIKRTIDGVFVPDTKEEILELLDFANTQGKKIWPISSGKNWGYGSSTPVVDGNIILDLGKLNEINDFDKSNGIITLGPGVTQGQLYDFLEGSDFIVPSTGAGPSVSVLGNLLERGYGLAPIQDHFSSLISLKAYLADGTEYNSSLSEIVGDKLGKKFKWGIGPYLNGIFTQSNFGIVTEVTIQLGRKAKHIELVKFTFSENELPEIVISIKALLAEYPSMFSGINLMNKERMISMGAADASDWTGIFSIGIDKKIAKIMKAIVKKKLKPNAKVIFINKRKLDFLGHLPLSDKLKLELSNANEMLGILNGKPTQVALNLCYLKNDKKEKTFNPAMDDCGLIWYSPLVEMDGKSVVDYVSFIRETCEQFNMEPLITLTSLSHSIFDSTIPILFSRSDDNDETLNAHNCYNKLLDVGKKHGYYPYRMGVGHMQELTSSADVFFSIAQRIKTALDPNCVIAPKRYSKV